MNSSNAISEVDKFLTQGSAVVKSNVLIRGSYDLSSNEQKIIYALAAQIRPQDSDFKEYTFSIADFYKLLDSNTKNKYKVFRETVHKLATTNFTFKEGKDTVTVAWLSGVRYHEREGLVTLTFHQWLRPYLLQLKSYFTVLNPKCVYHLSGKHSIRLFEYLKSYSFLKKDIFVGLADLKETLSLSDKYPQFRDFNASVLKKAQVEFEKEADIIFTYTLVRGKGRKVIGIEFHIEPNPDYSDEDINSLYSISAVKNAPCSQDMCLLRMKEEFNISDKVARELLKLRSGSNINLILNKVQAEYEAGRVRDLTRFSVIAIKDGYYDEELELPHKYEQGSLKFDNKSSSTHQGIPDIIKEQVEKLKRS